MLLSSEAPALDICCRVSHALMQSDRSSIYVTPSCDSSFPHRMPSALQCIVLGSVLADSRLPLSSDIWTIHLPRPVIERTASAHLHLRNSYSWGDAVDGSEVDGTECRVVVCGKVSSTNSAGLAFEVSSKDPLLIVGRIAVIIGFTAQCICIV
jgi:hypothetical protein